MIVRGNRQLEKLYHQLSPGDIFIGKILAGSLRHAVLIDLLERGVHCIPAPLSQSLHCSNAVQAMVLNDWMLPYTLVIRRRTDLIAAINEYGKHNIGPVVTKEDRMHCGHGIRRWENVEALYNIVALAKSSYPIVLQPFQTRFTDVRVIIIGSYVEAYVRSNPHNFRMNISSGGRSHPYELDKEKEVFCRKVMERGKFPYAHLDLQILENGTCYLSEIALDGGIKGAKIDRAQLDHKKKDLLEELAETIEGSLSS